MKNILSNQLFKNFSYLALAELFTKLVAFVIVIYLARIIGPEGYGKLAFAQAFLVYFTLITNLGLDVYGVREIAKDRAKSSEVLTNILVLKLSLFLISFLLVFVFSSFLPKDPLTIKIILLLSLSMLFNALMSIWYFQAIENFKTIAFAKIIQSIAYATLVFLLIKNEGQLASIVIYQLIGLFLASFYMYMKYKSNLNFKLVKTSLWTEYIKVGTTLAASFFMIQIYYNLDKLMLGFYFEDKYVGWYDAAYKIVMLSLVLNAVLWDIFKAKIARYELDKLILFIKLMLFSGFSLMIIMVFFNEFIIQIIFGEQFLPASSALLILGINVFLVFANVAFISPLQVWHEEKNYFYIVMSGGVVNIIFNFILIPSYDIVGASIATCIAEVVVFIFGIRIFLKHYKLKKEEQCI